MEARRRPPLSVPNEASVDDSIGCMGDLRPLVLLLWDVDHTLIDNGGVSKANYALAFELLTGRPATVPAKTGGRTDVEIVESLLRDNGRDPADYPAEDQWRS
jgi:hypothetical protein